MADLFGRVIALLVCRDHFSVEARTELLGMHRLGKTEHDVVAVIPTEVSLSRAKREPFAKVVSSQVPVASALFCSERDLVGPARIDHLP
jgi:hypothetical protein